MQCPYCRSLTCEDEHRCQRCGRRFDSDFRIGAPSAQLGASRRSSYGSIPATRQSSALALDTHYQPAPQPQPSPQEQPSEEHERGVYQYPLFALSQLSKVVPFEYFAPWAGKGTARRGRTGSRATARRGRAVTPVKETPFYQQKLDLSGAVGFGPDAGAVRPEASVCCDLPVASPVHRALASFFDIALALTGVAVFFSVFHFAGGTFSLETPWLILLGSATAVIVLVYELFWALAGRETPGMRWAQLRLVRMDGRRPERAQFMTRFAGNLVSLLPLGLGLIWAWMDEEGLAWHDQISGTFPTVRARLSQAYQRH